MYATTIATRRQRAYGDQFRLRAIYTPQIVVDGRAGLTPQDQAIADRLRRSGRPLHLVRVGLADGSVQLTEICGLPNGIIANPPAIDAVHRVAVGYDSSNGVVAAFRFDQHGVTAPLWTKQMLQAAHPLLFPDTGEVVLFDFDIERNMDQVVVLRIETGEELARADTGSPVQSAVFGGVGWERDLYICSFATVSRVSVRAPQQ